MFEITLIQALTSKGQSVSCGRLRHTALVGRRAGKAAGEKAAAEPTSARSAVLRIMVGEVGL